MKNSSINPTKNTPDKNHTRPELASGKLKLLTPDMPSHSHHRANLPLHHHNHQRISHSHRHKHSTLPTAQPHIRPHKGHNQ